MGDVELRRAIREALPPGALRPRPRRTLFFVPLVAAIVGGSAALALVPLPWWAALPASLAVGGLYGSLFFFGHELAHGAMTRSRRLQDLLLYVAFLVYCLSPHLWRVWHHVAHHAHTNLEDRDPDNFGTYREFLEVPATRFLARFAPGSGQPWSFVYLFTFFTLHTQGVLWMKSGRPDFRSLDRRRAAVETAAMALFWIALGVALGPRGALWVVVVPMLGANFTILSYIVTNHMMRPLTDEPDVLATTMSVTTWRWLDRLHFHFSHHVEHHLFPSMPTSEAPRVRAVLQRIAGDRYMAPPHAHALAVLFASPRVYDGHQTLIEPYSERRVAIPRVEAALRRPEASPRRALAPPPAAASPAEESR